MPILESRAQRLMLRGHLLAALERKEIVLSLVLLGDGNFTINTVGWDHYWNVANEPDGGPLTDHLSTLQKSWAHLVEKGFANEAIWQYCTAYGQLLAASIDNVTQSDTESARTLLAKVLGFECFGLEAKTGSENCWAAATTTFRNPNYLLAKIANPDRPDDTANLPLISIPEGHQAEYFYHYRRVTLAPHSFRSVLLYPAVSLAKRSQSFRAIDSFLGAATQALDPRSAVRGHRIATKIFLPLAAMLGDEGESHDDWEFVDLGAGSGSMVAAICLQLARRSISTNANFRVWSIDLKLGDPTRFAKFSPLIHRVDNWTFIAEDFRAWVDLASPLPARSGIRVALMSKLLNNFSAFGIEEQRSTSSSPV